MGPRSDMVSVLIITDIRELALSLYWDAPRIGPMKAKQPSANQNEKFSKKPSLVGNFLASRTVRKYMPCSDTLVIAVQRD